MRIAKGLATIHGFKRISVTELLQAMILGLEVYDLLDDELAQVAQFIDSGLMYLPMLIGSKFFRALLSQNKVGMKEF